MKGRPWTADEDETVRLNYADWPTYLIAYLVNRSDRAVYQRAESMGLKKSAAYLASDKAGRIQRGRTDPRMVGTQFRKGHAPANKGRPQAEWMPAASRKRCQRTQFRKGERHGAAACNYVPVGTRKVRDGLLCVKQHDAGPYPAARWVPVHRLVWEAANGPVPAGHIAVFKPGKATTEEARITADRVEVITRAENMRRNSYHTRYPPEVRQVIQLAGALKRKINNRRKQHGNAQ